MEQFEPLQEEGSEVEGVVDGTGVPTLNDGLVPSLHTIDWFGGAAGGDWTGHGAITPPGVKGPQVPLKGLGNELNIG